jgi:hypothetical protein
MDHKYLYSFLLLFLIGFASAATVTNQTIGAEPDIAYNLTDIPCLNPVCVFPDTPLFYFEDSLIPYGENNTHYGTNSNCQIIPYGEYDNGTGLVDSPYTDQDNPVNWSVSYEYTCPSTEEETCTPFQSLMFYFIIVAFAASLIFWIFTSKEGIREMTKRAIVSVIFIALIWGMIASLC